MHIKKKIIGAVASGILLSSLGCGEMRTHHWSNTKEIKGGVNGGWLIVEPPPSARDITLIYKIDTSEVWEFFQIDESDMKHVTNGCEEIAYTDVSFPRVPKKHLFFAIPGWPEGLSNKSRTKIEGVKLFRCTQPPPYQAWQGPNYYYLAIDKNTSKVFAWNNDGA